MKKQDYYTENLEQLEKQKEQRTQSFNGMSASEWAKHSRSVWKDLPPLTEDPRLKKMIVLPVDLIDRIVNIYSKEDDKVLDPFMGAGSTGVACKNLDRDFIGIEIDEKYFKIAKERIKDNNKKENKDELTIFDILEE